MKRFQGIMIFLCALIIFSAIPCCSQSEGSNDETSLADVLFQLQKWREETRNIAYKEDNDDKKTLVLLAGQMLDVSMDLVAKQLSSSQALKENMGDILYQECSTSYDGKTYYCQTEPLWLEDLHFYARLSYSARENYAKANLTYYSEAGKYIAGGGIELGKRDGVIRCLIIDFDPEEYTTGRYAFETRNDDIDVIFTRTFGEVFHTVLKIDQWVNGEDSEWNKSLLFSED